MMEQIIYIAVIAAAMVFGWLLSQRRQASRKGDEHAVARRTRKPRISFTTISTTVLTRISGKQK